MDIQFERGITGYLKKKMISYLMKNLENGKFREFFDKIVPRLREARIDPVAYKAIGKAASASRRYFCSPRR